jgi:hypothetical protein
MGLCYMKTSFPLSVVGLHLFPITILASCYFFFWKYGGLLNCVPLVDIIMQTHFFGLIF